MSGVRRLNTVITRVRAWQVYLSVLRVSVERSICRSSCTRLVNPYRLVGPCKRTRVNSPWKCKKSPTCVCVGDSFSSREQHSGNTTGPCGVGYCVLDLRGVKSNHMYVWCEGGGSTP